MVIQYMDAKRGETCARWLTAGRAQGWAGGRATFGVNVAGAEVASLGFLLHILRVVGAPGWATVVHRCHGVDYRQASDSVSCALRRVLLGHVRAHFAFL